MESKATKIKNLLLSSYNVNLSEKEAIKAERKLKKFFGILEKINNSKKSKKK